tara:strand:+ start:337 stop:555 length:219 start_codon:yes stop_codon:yes gene_type:complete
MNKWSKGAMDKNNVLVKKFFKTRTATDKIMLKFQEWSDFNKMPQKNLASADEESWEMFCGIIKMIKAFNRRK